MERCAASSARAAIVRPWLAIVLAGLLLYGCGPQYASLPRPEPVPSPLPAPPPTPEPTPVYPERVPQPAAARLLHDAEQALHAGNARKADEYLERAIRIDPQNPQVWHVLARSKFQQLQYPQTIQMALKSNSFRPDRAIERNNWLLMEQAYLAMGDTQKAEKARARAGY